MRLNRVLIFLLLVAAAPAVVRAQTAPPPSSEPLVLTLAQAVERAVAAAPRLAEAQAREAAAESTTAARRAGGVPTVTTSAGYLRTNHVEPFGFNSIENGFQAIFEDVPNNYRARAELTVPIYTSGRVGSLVDAAEADQQAASADRQTTLADVRLDAARAYWVLVLARADIGVLERGLERADAVVNDVGARVNAGFLPPNDLLSAQAQRARQRVRLIQARNIAALGEAELARLVGAPIGQPLQLASTVDQPTPGMEQLGPADTPDALLARAREQRTERLGLTARQASFRAVADAARATNRPQVGAIAALEPSRPNPRFVPKTDSYHMSWDLGVSVTWQLFDGGRGRADAAAAAAQAAAVGHRLEDFDAGLRVEVRQRLLDIASNRAALEASGEAVTAATEAQRVVGERFAAGVATSTDLLDAELARLEAEIERTRLQAAIRLGEARLLRAIGVF